MKLTNYLFAAIVGILFCNHISAQTKLGDNSTSINAGSVLELESTNKGLLLPRISLTNTTTWGLSGTAVNGMVVYNTNVSITSSNTTYPVLSGGDGVYYWDGAGWIGLNYSRTNTSTVMATLSSTGASVSLTASTLSYTGTTLTLPPGKWVIYANMLINPSSCASGQSIWIRSTLSNSSSSGAASTDIVGSGVWFSGSMVGPSTYALLNAQIIINNTSASSKTYYYWLANATLTGYLTSPTINNFGSSVWGEDVLYAVPMY